MLLFAFQRRSSVYTSFDIIRDIAIEIFVFKNTVDEKISMNQRRHNKKREKNNGHFLNLVPESDRPSSFNQERDEQAYTKRYERGQGRVIALQLINFKEQRKRAAKKAQQQRDKNNPQF